MLIAGLDLGEIIQALFVLLFVVGPLLAELFKKRRKNKGQGGLPPPATSETTMQSPSDTISDTELEGWEIEPVPGEPPSSATPQPPLTETIPSPADAVPTWDIARKNEGAPAGHQQEPVPAQALPARPTELDEDNLSLADRLRPIEKTTIAERGGVTINLEGISSSIRGTADAPSDHSLDHLPRTDRRRHSAFAKAFMAMEVLCPPKALARLGPTRRHGASG